MLLCSGSVESTAFWNIYDAGHGVSAHVLVNGLAALGPFPCRCVGADKEHGNCGDYNEDARDDKSDAPRGMCGLVLAVHKAVVDGRHHEVRDAAPSIPEARRQGIGGPDDILVEEARRPDLAWHKGAAEDPDEKADGIQAFDVSDAARAKSWDGSGEENACKGVTRTEAVAAWAGDKTHEKRGDEADDVGGEDIGLRGMDVFGDNVIEERRKSVPEDASVSTSRVLFQICFGDVADA